MSYNYIFQKKLLHMKTKGSMYETHLFSENSPRKSVCIRNALFSYEVICIMRQKYKAEQLPVLWNIENKSRQNVCLASCITSVDVHLISHSTGSGISQVYDHNRKSFAIFWIFRWQNNLHEIFFLVLKRFYLLINLLGFLHKYRKIWVRKDHACKYSPPFLSLESSPFPCLLSHKMLQESWKPIAFDCAVAKQQKKTP